MPRAVTSVFQRLGATVKSFSVAQRTIAIIGIAVLVLGSIALATWLSRPSMSPLFTGLSASDANAVVEQLKSSGVQYELTDGGATVLVPEDSVYDQRLAAASAGLPSSTSEGYTLLDDMGVTTSEFQQSVTYKRAIEGELADTISSLDGVTAASVQLAIPEESVFVSEKVDPTASVFIETEKGAALSNGQVDAIVHLTSAAITDLKSENVAVIDQSGDVLSAVGVGTTGSADQQASEYEMRVSQNIQQMLDTIVGAGNATVTVAAEMDLSSSELLEEQYSAPEGDISTDEKTKSEKYSGGGGGGSGVLGPDNIGVPGGGGTGNYESTETTRNNAINKSTEKTTTPSGAIDRQSVSVAVDSDAAENIDLGEIQNLVTTAAGIDPARGDDVTVALVAFSKADANAAQEALQAAKDAAEADRMNAIIRTSIIAAAIVITLVAGLILYARRNKQQTRESIELTQLEEPTEFDQLLEAPTEKLSLEPSEPAPEPDPEPEEISINRRRAEIDAIAGRDPGKTAELLRTLMDDRNDA
ncbi:flagellar basal-body MS-ring/collar protein FliF [Paramicrobacterium agarici]|uniref:Flagellar M-ring protein n=1 Tax=Paramicrobacterium agarici TaxID=630514 RepID=A0A2A9DXG5_9MICO|nr:flagellar basal-body MS-ring/collar protein FliF [Microbacterium agarici]PFG30609.1 flagellar M-ring protein FliF [Microbacterium agarici]TQO23627.1 flagellar M-ring protein FliF [Microbacterium agarici]